ncbi:MAG: CDP-glycerol glycerophosphotransferase family protein [Coriobacteriales bacterium]|nr:CDP-glycerol glycerophosphotransferase family protein [Coriobacteriales bacterium]
MNWSSTLRANGFYKYFSGIIDYLLKHSDITIHYVTSDPNDHIFTTDIPRICPWFIDNRDLIAFFMKLDADLVLMTTPDLDRYHLKRSIVRDDVEYVYLDHGMSSFHLMLQEGALDHFDTVFAYGPNHIAELRQTEAAYGLPQKTIVKTGFGLLDELLVRVAALAKEVQPEADGTSGEGRSKNPQSRRLMEKADTAPESPICAVAPDAATTSVLAPATAPAILTSAKKQILIAPSWQQDNIMDLCLDELLSALLKQPNLKIVLRPHPEYVKRFAERMAALLVSYQEKLGPDFVIETDFAANETVYRSDLVITDWSTTAMEFSYATKRPSLFINTPMKMMNPNYQRIEAIPLDISLRERLGQSVEVTELASIPAVIAQLTSNSGAWTEKITAIVDETIYDVGDGSRSGAEYLISRISYQRELRAWYKSLRPAPNTQARVGASA